MKRFLFSGTALICAAAVMATAGCASALPGTLPPSLDKAFGAHAEISANGVSCGAQMRRLGAGRWEFCLTEPYPLEGMIITTDGEKTSVKLYDLEAKADISSGAVSAARLISAAFEAAVSQGGELVSDGKTSSIEGSCEYGAYSIKLAADGTPAGITVPDRGISVAVSDFTETLREDESEDAYISE